MSEDARLGLLETVAAAHIRLADASFALRRRWLEAPHVPTTDPIVRFSKRAHKKHNIFPMVHSKRT